MKETQASGTATGAAAVRAIESEKPASERICYDPFARRFIEPWVYLLMKLFVWYGEWHTKGGLTWITRPNIGLQRTASPLLKPGVLRIVNTF
jgi:O-methyltransferase involved in polyketide biosynthesis